MIRPSHKKIFIDEVQRIPSLFNRVQANLLPGRILNYEIGPLTHEELLPNFDLNLALNRGLLPGVYWSEAANVAKKPSEIMVKHT